MANTPMITDANGRIVPGSVALLEKREIGGLGQWLIIRGKSTSNPVLLFLHGGPGSAEWPLVRHYNSILEDYFIIVYWEQRCAGKSYSGKTPNLNVAQFISDTHDIIEYLRKRFNQDKIFVIGHSWGSLLGILTVQKYPELFYAYIGTGQFVTGKENEALSYQYVMDIAVETDNKKALRQLNQLNYPEPYGTIDREGKWFKKLLLQREWLFKFHGCIYEKTNQFQWIMPYFRAPEYGIKDLIKWIRGIIFSIKALWPEIMGYDLFKQLPKLEVPVYFLIGRHDYNTPFELAEKYFQQLEAPQKELIWFDNSAHCPMYEEAKKFNDFLIEKVRREIGEPSHAKKLI